MENLLPLGLRRAWLRVSIAGTLLCAAAAGQSGPDWFPPLPADTGEQPTIIEHYPEKPSVPPEFTIPVGPLGYSAPGAIFLFHRQNLVSLDFLDENRMLFTFRAPGLMRREGEGDADDKAREIRAVVVTLPDGKVEADAMWVVPDRARYVWMLKDGRFLLRDADGLEEGDASLKTKPFLRLPGRLLWVETDPADQVLVTNTLEAGAAQTAGGAAGPNEVQASQTADGQKPGAAETLVVRTMRLETGEVIKTMRVPWTRQDTDWPVNAEGYVESVKEGGAQWALKLDPFAGGNRIVGRVESSCAPNSTFMTEEEQMITTCDPGGGGKLIAMSTAGGPWLWEARTASNTMWPLLVVAPDGSRLARETLVLKRPDKRYKHLVGADDLRGQMVRVMDAADGKVKLEAPVSPVLDGGGNVAISPSGRRVAILNDGAIEVFELPEPAKLKGATPSVK
jgi:hypothetical protein